VPNNIENVIIETELGFSPYEALVHATSNAAKVLSWSGELNQYKGGELGVIKEGAFADLLVVDGNPLQDITVLRDRDNLRVIMKDGVPYKNTLVPPSHPSYKPSVRPVGHVSELL
jgi:imidazolonepropionase-like amidohydrolase